MSAVAKISFLVEAIWQNGPPVYAVVPVINGTALTGLVTAFESERHFDKVGGYAGIVPKVFNYGPLDRYFLGQVVPDRYWQPLNGIYVLGCDCGEVGCWPLECRVKLEGDAVVWSHFKQPHRPKHDYSDFGPFVFGAKQYRSAVSNLKRQFAAQLPEPEKH